VEVPNVQGLKAIDNNNDIYTIYKIHFVPNSHTHQKINSPEYVANDDK